MAKVASIIANLVTVPLILNYLGAEQYGVWITITSVFLILGVADFGIGNGLLNMKRRASDLRGEFSVQSVPGGGARIEVVVPLRSPVGV